MGIITEQKVERKKKRRIEHRMFLVKEKRKKKNSNMYCVEYEFIFSNFVIFKISQLYL